jgi:hypothetical protein
MSTLSNIQTVDFPRNQYYRVRHPKDRIVLHHPVGPVGVDVDLAWRQTDVAEIGSNEHRAPLRTGSSTGDAPFATPRFVARLIQV